MSIIRECKLIPSPDDERDWILDSYYRNLDKKKSLGAKNIPNQNNSIMELNLETNNSVILDFSLVNNYNLNIGVTLTILNQWFIEYNYKTKIKISPSFIPTTEDISTRDAIELFRISSRKINENMEKRDRRDSKDSKDRRDSKENTNQFIKNYARIYSIDVLKKSLYDNGPAIMILPIYETKNWISNNSKLLYGEPFIVYGYNKLGFLIKKNNGVYDVFLYDNWGCQWEVWTLLNIIKSKGRKSLGDLKKFLCDINNYNEYNLRNVQNENNLINEQTDIGKTKENIGLNFIEDDSSHNSNIVECGEEENDIDYGVFV
jgi:hypothetical protein